MNKQTILALIAGLVIGGLTTFGIVSTNTSNNTMGNETTPNNNAMDHGTGGSMSDMNAALKGKTGDEFDKEFITQMIEHHQGAIDMAKQAQMNAGHDEIKNLSTEIITAQEKEINQMKQWQMDWEYTQ